MRYWKSIFCFCTIVISLQFACKDKSSTPEKLSIAVIPKGTTHMFWQSVHAGALKAEHELDIQVLWMGPEKEDDRQQQIALVDNQVMNQVSGIVLAPLDALALRRPVRNAVQKKVPVLIIDSGLEDSEDIYTSFVATDNQEGGRIAGRELSNLLNGTGNVVMLRFVEGSASTEKRADGFLEAISTFKDINVLSSEQYGGATNAQAQQVSENLLLRFMDESGVFTVNGIFCVNESTTYGMLQALRRSRLAGKVKFIGFDSADALIEGLSMGEIDGLIVQNPFKMGYLGVKTIVSSIRGEKVAKRIDTGVKYVAKENMQDKDIQELIHPDLETWLGK